jgi:hypothetical protein
LSHALRAAPLRLDDPPTIAVAADHATGLEHPGKRELSGATEIDDGLAVHCWSSLLVGSADWRLKVNKSIPAGDQCRWRQSQGGSNVPAHIPRPAARASSSATTQSIE